MDIETVKRLLRNHGLKPNFTYGQNFLLDEKVLHTMLEAAGVNKKDQILEIGPGIGNLTRLLCENAGFVLSVEKDSKFLPFLKPVKKDFPENFRYEIADILEYDFQNFFEDRPYKVVANIPYFITGKILEMLMTAKHKPEIIVVLTQKEVAQRVAAQAGGLSILALSVQLWGEPEIVELIPAKSFYPAPKVDSAVLRIRVFEQPRVELTDERLFFRVVRACFAGKRKQLHNTLTHNLRLEKSTVLGILDSLGIEPNVRPQKLTLQDWAELAKAMQTSQAVFKK